MRQYLLVIFCMLFFSCNSKKYDNPHIIIDTNYGEIEAELYSTKAPKSVVAILSYIDAGYYKNSSFYRVLKNEDATMETNYGIIQAGTWPNKKDVPTIEHESTRLTGLTHSNGTLSLARTAVGTATTEFFICIGEETMFDAGNSNGQDTFGFAAFGRVTSGMSIVRKIQAQKNNDDLFETKIKINDIKKQ